MIYKPKTNITNQLWGWLCESVKACRIQLSRQFRRRVVGSLCVVTVLATSLVSAMPMLTYAEVIKRNATASTTATAQNYLNKGTSSMADLSYSKLLSNGSKYSLITDTTLLPTLYSNWRATSVDSWYFYGDDGSVKTGWLYDNGWYYLSTEDEGTAGLMKYGWYQDNAGAWYFLNTIHDGTFGRAVSGWQWIDGYSYYFDSNCKLVTDGQTEDGYTVDSDGRWTVDGEVQFVEGKGLTSQIVYLDSSATNSDSSYATNDDTSSNNSHSPNTQNSKYYTVTFDYQDGQTIYTLQVVEGGYATEPTSLYREGYYFLAWYENPTDLTNAFSFSTTPINENKTLYAVWLDVVNDSDGDGLLDGLEAVIGTDASKVDTDSDGLSDYDEYYTTHSNPLEAYSMVSTVLDALVDIDGDGLTNIEEIEFGSDPLYKDTDDDGLSDSEEKGYGTNLDKADTDSDGLADGLEITYGFNPLVSDTDGNGVLDGDEIIRVSASYEGEGTSRPTAQIRLKAGSASNISIERDDPATSIWMPEGVPGLIDAAYDFHVDGQIEEATLTFHFTQEQSDDFYPVIYYIDTENQEMVQLEEQTIDWDAKTVTAKTTHFSYYSLLNEREQEKAWNIEILSSSDVRDTRLDISLVIDESITMSGSDINLGRVDIARNILDVLRVGDRATVVGFDSDVRVYQELTTNLDAIKHGLSQITNGDKSRYQTLSTGIWGGIYSLIDSPYVREPEVVMATAEIEEDHINTAVEYDTSTKDMMATSSMAYSDVATMSDAIEEELTESTYSEYNISDIETYLSYALAMSSNTDESLKIIVLITDAKDATFAPALEAAIENGIVIYTVQIDEGGNAKLLRNIAENTGGKYYSEGEIDKLISELTQLTSSSIDINTDSDLDGLSDYHEERIRLHNGMMISLNSREADTEGDGILDGHEIVETKDRKGRVYFKTHSNPSLIDSDGDGRNDSVDELPLYAQKIDRLGDEEHLASVEERITAKLMEMIDNYRDIKARHTLDSWGADFMMEDYYTFLEERGIVIEGKYREDYWNDAWDTHWDEYCNAFNEYVINAGSVSKKLHYFRNNLNRIPKTLDELLDDKSEWVLLEVDDSVFHMYETTFVGDGTYVLKLMSKDGKHEGVYVNLYGNENDNLNKGKPCTEKTDSKNMGTYNYDGRYLSDTSKKLNHYFLDVEPYYEYGNTMIENKPGKGRVDTVISKIGGNHPNIVRYNNNIDAIWARSYFQAHLVK